MTEPSLRAPNADTARTRALRGGMLTALVQRTVAAVIPIAAVPLGLQQLGAAGYGVWATALAFTALFAFSDLGIGTGLMTRLGASGGGAAQRPDDRALVSSAYAIVAAIVVVLEAGLILAALLFDVASFFGAPGDRHVELIACLTLSGFLLNVVASLVVRVQYAVGRQTASNLWQTAGSVATFAGILSAAKLSDGPSWFVFSAAYVPVAMSVANSVWFFGFTQAGRMLKPSLRHACRSVAGSLLGLGSRFLVVSVLLALAVAGDPWIVAQTTDLTEVPNFAVPSRVFTSVGLISVLALLPLWPMNARAIAQGETAWVRRTTRRMTSMVVIGVSVIAMLILLGSNLLVDVWLDNEISVDQLLWAGLAVWCVAQAFAGPMFMVQNSAEVLGPQTVGYLLLVLTLPVKWWVASDYGYEWIPWVTVIGYLMFVVPGCFVGYRRALEIADAQQAEVAR